MLSAIGMAQQRNWEPQNGQHFMVLFC